MRPAVLRSFAQSALAAIVVIAAAAPGARAAEYDCAVFPEMCGGGSGAGCLTCKPYAGYDSTCAAVDEVYWSGTDRCVTYACGWSQCCQSDGTPCHYTG